MSQIGSRGTALGWFSANFLTPNGAQLSKIAMNM